MKECICDGCEAKDLCKEIDESKSLFEQFLEMNVTIQCNLCGGNWELPLRSFDYRDIQFNDSLVSVKFFGGAACPKCYPPKGMIAGLERIGGK